MSQEQRPGPSGDRSSAEILLRWAAMVPVPARRPKPLRRNRSRIVVAAAVILALVAAGVMTVRVLGRDDSTGATAARGAPTAPAPAPPAPTSPPSASTPSPPSTSPTSRADGVAGVTAPGILVDVVPTAEGELEVVEHVLLRGATTTLDLALPTLKGIRKDARPSGMHIEDLRITGDGQPMTIDPAGLRTGGSVLLPTAPREVDLRYRLTGAVVVSRPSTPGRALVVVPPVVTGESVRGLPTVVVARGSRIRNVICPGLLSEEQLCGRQSSGSWSTVEVRRDATAVVLQLDLPGR